MRELNFNRYHCATCGSNQALGKLNNKIICEECFHKIEEQVDGLKSLESALEDIENSRIDFDQHDDDILSHIRDQLQDFINLKSKELGVSED